MTFTQSIRTCFRKYVTFSGRASRSEYWWFFLFLILGSILLGVLDAILFGASDYATEATHERIAFEANSNGPLVSIFNIATVVPALSAGWRRMHDTGRSGLYLLYPLIAMIGLGSFIGFMAGFENLFAGDFPELVAGGLGIVVILALVVLILSPFIVLFWLTRPSQQGANRYGPNPHEVHP